MELNKIYNTDCMLGIKTIDNNSIHCTLTDIPYGVVNRDTNGLRNLDKENADVMTFDLKDFLQEIYRVTKGTIIIFCSKEQISEIYNFFSNKQKNREGTVRQLIWEKTNPSPMNGQFIYLSGVENAVWFKKRGATFNAHCKNTVFKHPNGKRQFHPTQKNLELFKELILDNTDKGDIILDPCMGGGTTAIACKELDRNYIGFEINKDYYDKILERIG